MISVIIPTYKEPEYLDLCLKSCIEGQDGENEIIVVVDGFYEMNKPILEKWSKYIKCLPLDKNMGFPYAVNMGVYNASNEWILIVNDDNVFMKGWDTNLNKLQVTEAKLVVSLNQIEPNPSIFPQFVIENYGKSIDEFDLDNFWKNINKHFQYKLTTEGGTFPIFLKKDLFMCVGGWDINYPTNGVVADWDFFLKCELAGAGMLRDYSTLFYHFAQVSTGAQRAETEMEGHALFQYKWRRQFVPMALRNYYQ